MGSEAGKAQAVRVAQSVRGTCAPRAPRIAPHAHRRCRRDPPTAPVSRCAQARDQKSAGAEEGVWNPKVHVRPSLRRGHCASTETAVLCTAGGAGPIARLWTPCAPFVRGTGRRRGGNPFTVKDRQTGALPALHIPFAHVLFVWLTPSVQVECSRRSSQRRAPHPHDPLKQMRTQVQRQ